MKKNLLSLGAAIILILLLVCLTGCENENLTTNETIETEQLENEQEEIKQNKEENAEGNALKVGNYTVKYGWYSDGNVSNIKINEDGTLHRGGIDYSYTVEGDCINVENKMELRVTDNNCFDQVVNGNVMTSYTYSELN